MIQNMTVVVVEMIISIHHNITKMPMNIIRIMTIGTEIMVTNMDIDKTKAVL